MISIDNIIEAQTNTLDKQIVKVENNLRRCDYVEDNITKTWYLYDDNDNIVSSMKYSDVVKEAELELEDEQYNYNDSIKYAIDKLNIICSKYNIIDMDDEECIDNGDVLYWIHHFKINDKAWINHEFNYFRRIELNYKFNNNNTKLICEAILADIHYNLLGGVKLSYKDVKEIIRALSVLTGNNLRQYIVKGRDEQKNNKQLDEMFSEEDSNE